MGDGRRLSEILADEGPLPPARVLNVVRGMAAELEQAHARGEVHGSLQPSKVLVTGDDRVRLVEFGGMAPGYAAPEQHDGQGAEARTDQYALGVVIHEMLTGANPFARADPVETARAHRELDYNRLPALPAGVPATLKLALRRLLEKDPQRRFPSAGQFAASLEEPILPAAAGTAPEEKKPEPAAPTPSRVAASDTRPRDATARAAHAKAAVAFLLIAGVGGTAVFFAARQKEPEVKASVAGVASALPTDPEAAVKSALTRFDAAGKVRALEHEHELATKGPDAQRNTDMVRRRWTARLEHDARGAQLAEALAKGKVTRAEYRMLRELETLAACAAAVKVAWTPPPVTYPATYRPVAVKDLAPRRTFGLTLGGLRLGTPAAAGGFLARKLGAFEELHLDDLGLLKQVVGGHEGQDGTVRLDWTNPQPVLFPEPAAGEVPVLEVVLASPLPRMTWLEVRLSADGKTWREPLVLTQPGCAQLGHLLEPADLHGARFVDVQLARVTQANAQLDSASLQAVFVHLVDAAAAQKLAAP